MLHRPLRRLQTSRDTTGRVYFAISKNKTKSSVELNLAIANTQARAGRHAHCRYNLDIDFNISQVLPTQVPPLGGCCSWRPTD
ncbi:hypothetical protein V1477_018481 [Vespula maculifrons]|uniref:Uncharacterized protein n=1 Tax=Vespula maculifrons TaxID=7453 RepID=A0ABD2AVW0_VESMC